MVPAVIVTAVELLVVLEEITQAAVAAVDLVKMRGQPVHLVTLVLLVDTAAVVVAAQAAVEETHIVETQVAAVAAVT
jgi:hypothetical protein